MVIAKTNDVIHREQVEMHVHLPEIWTNQCQSHHTLLRCCCLPGEMVGRGDAADLRGCQCLHNIITYKQCKLDFQVSANQTLYMCKSLGLLLVFSLPVSSTETTMVAFDSGGRESGS